MAITLKLMTISCLIIMVPEILQLFDAHELHICIFNGHLIIKYELCYGHQKLSCLFMALETSECSYFIIF